MSTTHAMPQGIRNALKPRERMSMSQWARRRFLIAEKGAVRPGPYDLDLTPFWREPMDAMSDPAVRNVIIVACAQSGKTQIGNIFIAHTASERPCNMLYVRPTEDDVVEAMRDRFAPMIQGNADLRRLLPAAGEWISISKNPAIRLSSCIIYGAAASVPRQATSRTCPKVLFDEIDNCEDASGALGNTWSLVLERQAAASILHCKAVAMGTPNDESGTNWQEYLKSDMREYHEPCPLCGGYQAIKLGNIEVAQGMRDPILIRHHQAAAYRCTHCGELIEQRHQGWMADRGIWVPACQQVAEPLPLSDVDIVDRRALALAEDSVRWTPKLTGEVPINPQRGYRVWRANTKFEQCTWSNILARFLEVHKHPEQMKVFANAWLAEPWRDAVRSADVDTVRDRIGVYEAQVVPTRTKVVLGFVDVQLDCLWYVFRAFGPNQESWLIDFGTVEVHGRDHGAALDTLYKWAFYRGWVVSGQAPDTATAKALRMRAYAIAVDSGAFTDEVYEFARRGGVVPTKGRDQADFRVRASQVEGKKRPDPLTLYHLNTTVFKDRLQRLIQTQPGQPGEWHLHRDTTDEYVAQLTSEHAVRERTKGKARAVRRWMKKAEGIANHLLDCESGVLGLAEILEQKREVSVMTLRDEDPAEGLFRPGIVPSKPAAPAQPVGRIKGFEGRGGGIPRS